MISAFLFFGLAFFRLAHERLVGDADDLVRAVAVEDDGVVDVGTVGDELVFLESGADESLVAVDVQFLVGFGHLGGDDGVEVPQFRAAGMLIAVFGLEQAEPVARDLHHVGQVAVDARDFLFHAEDGLVRLVFVELQDARHLDVHQPQYVVLGDFAYHLRIIRREAFVDVCAGGVHVFGLFERLVLVDAFLDEYLFRARRSAGFPAVPAF